MSGRRHFEQGDAGYARHRPSYPPQLADCLAGLCRRRDHAVDVGCGTGQLSLLLADRFARVTATDISESQIANAVLRDNIAYSVGSAEQIALPDASVDLIVAAQAAHWFDLPAFYTQARRLAAPGAVLALISYGIPQLDGPASARFDRFYWQDIHPYWPADRVHVEQGYQTLDFPFQQTALPDLFIERDWSLAELAGYIHTWSATRRAAQAGQSQVVADALADLAALWGDPAARYPVCWPINARVARL